MRFCYDGNTYHLKNVNSVNDLVKKIESLKLDDLIEDGYLKWNISFLIDNTFYDVKGLQAINFKTCKSITAILQLAGG